MTTRARPPKSWHVDANALPEAVLVIDGDANLLWANGRAEDLFGRTLEESVGINALDFLHPDDVDFAAVSIASVTTKEVGTPIELRVRGTEGWRTVEVIGTPIGDNVLLTLRDLTQRRRWEVAGSHLDRFRVILQNGAPPTFLLDAAGRVTSSSAALTRVFGIDQEAMEDEPLETLLVEEDRKVFRDALGELVDGVAGGNIHAELDAAVASPDGTRHPVSVTLANLLDDPTVEGVVATMHDVSRRVRAEEGLRKANSLVEATLDATAEGILAVDLEGRITSYNKRFVEMWHIPQDLAEAGSDAELLEYLARGLVEPRAFRARVQQLYADPESESHDLIRFRDGRAFERDGRPHKLAGETVGRVWSFRDVTATRALQKELARQASHDSLTGLANQRLFRELVGESLRSMTNAQELAVLFIDLDAFKHLNDSLGHLAGDEMLVNVATRLEMCVRHQDTVARLGGDEFAILATGLDDPQEAEEIARRILGTLADPILVMGRPMATTASIGIAYGRAGDTADEMLRNADLAMYVAKNGGRNRFRLFEPEMHRSAVRRLEIESGLRGAADRGELEVHYQPIVEPASGEVRALEALVRWAHTEKGLLGPGDFIPEAEQSDLIHEIGRHVLSVACKQATEWRTRSRGSDGPSIAVNVSARQLLDDDTFVGFVASALEDSALAASSLVLEITETALLDDPDAAARTMDGLTKLGVRLALDDFGTGHSSLSHLRRFPIDTLKVDREFIAEVESLRGRSLVTAVVQLAHSLGMTVVAEGVELESQRAVLEDFGCDLAQGFLFAKPMPASVATGHLATGLATART